MRRCCLLLILITTTTMLPSCSNLFVGVGTEVANCNMNPSLAHEWPSPDGERKAVEQHFDCPGWYALKIEITNPDKTKAVAFDDRPVDQVRPARWPDLKVEWKSKTELWITYPPRQDTSCISNAGGVQVHCLDAAVMR
jgi:hypothetical protein